MRGILVALGVAGVLLALNAAFVGSMGPGLAMPPYLLQVICLAGINVILAVSLNLINGFTGQFSIGHAGFMMVGGYAAAWVDFSRWPLGEVHGPWPQCTQRRMPSGSFQV